MLKWQLRYRRHCVVGSIAIVLSATVTACVTPSAEEVVATALSESAPTTATLNPQQRRLVPIADHHQHLLSPALARSLSEETTPGITVPPRIGELLRQRAELSADPEKLQQLFTADALVLGRSGTGWVRGAANAAETISHRYAPGYRFTPISLRDYGRAVELAGYFTRGERDSLRHTGYFSMTLHRDRSGNWRIAEETGTFPGPKSEQVVDGKALIEKLDAAGIQRAVVLSNAYYFGGVVKSGNTRERMRAENDWTAEQVSLFPNRLIAFCSVHPLADYALEELHRCAANQTFRGLKLHFDTGIDIRRADHAAMVRRTFAKANELGFPILVHVIAEGIDPGETTRAFLRDIVPAAPDVPIVVAHLWGGGPFSDGLLAIYAKAIAAARPTTKSLYFDLAQASLAAETEENLGKLALRMRQIGLERMLYGSDAAVPPRDVWTDFWLKVPLTEKELHIVATNVAPFAN